MMSRADGPVWFNKRRIIPQEFQCDVAHFAATYILKEFRCVCQATETAHCRLICCKNVCLQ